MHTSIASRRVWFAWGLAASFFLAEYFVRVSPSVMVEPLMRAFNVNAFGLGSLSAFFYYAYVAMQLPVGTLIDRFGARRLLTVMAALCGLSTLLFAHATHLNVAELARLLMGFSAAFAFVGALKLANTWFPAARFGVLAGTTQALGMLGAAIGEGPVSVLVAHVGWRAALHVIGGVLLLLALLIGFIVRDKPKPKPLAIAQHHRPAYFMPLLQQLWEVLKHSQTWINGAFVGFEINITGLD